MLFGTAAFDLARALLGWPPPERMFATCRARTSKGLAMGVIGQMPHAPDELPGRESTTGEPPWRTGPSAGELPTLPGSGTQSISVTVPLPGPTAEQPAETGEENQPG